MPGSMATKTTGLPIVNLAHPLWVQWTVPLSSPVVIGIIDARLSAGIIPTSTLGTKPTAIACAAKLGYGIGTLGGVRHTSGMPKFRLGPLLDAGSIGRRL